MFVSSSTDHGLTWSAPVKVSDLATAVMPWVAARNGKVDVVYYASTASSTDDPTAVWNTYDSQRLAGAWTVARVSPTPNRVGAVCLDGAACTANKRHMAPELFAELADATHAHAWAHGVDDASGWRVYHNGIASWWSAEGGLDAEGERRLYKLRSNVVAWLSERGIPEGHHPRATPRVRRRCPHLAWYEPGATRRRGRPLTGPTSHAAGWAEGLRGGLP